MSVQELKNVARTPMLKSQNKVAFRAEEKPKLEQKPDVADLSTKTQKPEDKGFLKSIQDTFSGFMSKIFPKKQEKAPNA